MLAVGAADAALSTEVPATNSNNSSQSQTAAVLWTASWVLMEA